MGDTPIIIGKRRREKHKRSKTHTGPIISMTDARRIKRTHRSAPQPRVVQAQPVRRSRCNTPRIFSHYVRNGTWSGKRCFIVGGGPSVNNVDLGKLKGELTIGINRAVELFEPSILFGVDEQLFYWNKCGQLGRNFSTCLSEYKGYKVWASQHEALPSDCYRVDTDSTKEHVIGTTRKLSCKNNSGYGALNLAAALGATEIYLLGFDMKGNGRGSQQWWHDGYPVDYGEEVYGKYMEQISNFAPVLESAGIKVVNLTKNSRLECFETSTLSKVMRKKQPSKPLVVSFYTRGTGYEDEAKRLMRELHLFGLEYDIRGIDGFGSWQKNTHYKAGFISEMLEEHGDRDLLWLDVDSAVCEYPDLFDDAEFELGVHIIDWKKYNKGRHDHQLANAVIYLKNVEKVRGFVRAWVNHNEQNPNRIEMMTMADVLEDWKDKLVFENIPASYCQIFDLMGSEGEPVIEQRQASRHFRDLIIDTNSVDSEEKLKYDECWTTGYSRSACAKPLIQHVLNTMDTGDRVLDIGCGDCTTVMGLRDAGVDCVGVDISLAGAPDSMYGVFESPVWNLPFDDNAFDYTVSTDVLEHVPTSMVEAAIREIYRVTRKRTFHVVALFDGIRNGVTLHMTVKPIDWWIERFESIDYGGLEVNVVPRNVFMMEK